MVHVEGRGPRTIGHWYYWYSHTWSELPVHTWNQGFLDGTEVTSVQGTRIVSSYVTSVEIGDGTWYSTVLPVVLYTILYYQYQ